MTRSKQLVGMAAAAALGLALAFLAERAIPPAQAGGVCEASPRNTYVTSNQDGNVLYEWTLGPNPRVVIYYALEGLCVHKDLHAAPGEKEPKPREVVPGQEGPEIVISGVIWTPNAETRIAIINGKSVREGEIFETRSGKKYKVVEIKRTEEVDYVEVK
jgi:hypothetical protein